MREEEIKVSEYSVNLQREYELELKRLMLTEQTFMKANC